MALPDNNGYVEYVAIPRDATAVRLSPKKSMIIGGVQVNKGELGTVAAAWIPRLGHVHVKNINLVEITAADSTIAYHRTTALGFCSTDKATFDADLARYAAG